MSGPYLLDLCCGAGGMSMGYSRAGFTVVGVDINPQPNYPFSFIQADALTCDLAGFDVIHASPPCPRYSVGSKHLYGNPEAHPDLIGPIRERLKAEGVPYVIENVVGAPLENPTLLCGTMFPGLRVIRHRLFESNAPLVPPPHIPEDEHPLCFTHDKRKAHYGKLDQNTSFVQVTGGGNCTVDNKRDAMGVPWMTGTEANDAIPPAYAEHIGRQLIDWLRDPQAYAEEIARQYLERLYRSQEEAA